MLTLGLTIWPALPYEREVNLTQAETWKETCCFHFPSQTLAITIRIHLGWREVRAILRKLNCLGQGQPAIDCRHMSEPNQVQLILFHTSRAIKPSHKLMRNNKWWSFLATVFGVVGSQHWLTDTLLLRSSEINLLEEWFLKNSRGSFESTLSCQYKHQIFDLGKTAYHLTLS